MSLLHSPTPLSTLEGHTAPVARVAFHPSGDYVASASFDGTWRLWDVETSELTTLLRRAANQALILTDSAILPGQELLLQEGHSKEVYAVAWQDDGALVATGSVRSLSDVEYRPYILTNTDSLLQLVKSQWS